MEGVSLALATNVVEPVFVIKTTSADHAAIIGAPVMPYIMADVVVRSKHILGQRWIQKERRPHFRAINSEKIHTPDPDNFTEPPCLNYIILDPAY